MEPCFSAYIPPLSGIHIKQLSPTFTWHYFRRLSPLSGTYSFFIIPPLYDTISLFLRRYYHTFTCGFIAASVPTFIWHFFITSQAGTCSAEGLFLHPPLLVTLTLHLLPYYSTLMWHFLRASPRSISTLLNMVSFSLFLSHLYMTLILFIIPRQYYSPQLLQGFSAEGFHITFCFQLDLSHIFPWLFFSKSQFYMDCMGGFYIQGLSAEGFNHRIFLYFLPFLLSAACPRKVFLLNIWSK